MTMVEPFSDVRPEVEAEVDRVLRERLIRPLYQPIVDLSDRTVVAVEALARGAEGTTLQRPDQIFGAAEQAGRLGEMDMMCTERAVEVALDAADPPPILFANAESSVLDQPMSPRMMELAFSPLPFRIILEYTERGLPTVPGALLRLAGGVELCGGGIALDDVGADPMSLAFLPVIEPEVIKLDMHLVRNPHLPSTVETCRIVRAAAQRTGAVVIAEGVETEEDLRTALALGATWGQGWLFGRPAPLDTMTFDRTPRTGTTLRAPQPGMHQPGGTPFEIAATGGHVRAGTEEEAVRAMARVCGAIGPDDAAVVIASSGDPHIAAQIARIMDSVTSAGAYVALICPESTARPAPGETTLAVVGTDSAASVCLRTTGDRTLIADSDVLPTAVSISRILLQRLTARESAAAARRALA